jgi:hypothetical protein
MYITSFSDLDSIPSAAEVNQAVTAVYTAMGFVKEDERRDNGKVRASLAALLVREDHLVETKGQRKSRALTRAQLVEEIFHVADPLQQDSPSVLDQLVHEKLSTALWGATSPNSKLQDAVHDLMDNGHYVARYLVKGEAPKAYASDKWDCLAADYTGRIQVSYLNKVETTTRILESMAEHRPADGRRILAASKKLLTSVEASHARVMLAVSAATDKTEAAETETDES